MVSNKDKRRTRKVRDTLKHKPLPSEEEVRAYFYRHEDAAGYALPKEKTDAD